MFSKMLTGLRAEAELVNAANCMMLANSHKQGWDLVDQVSGKAMKDRTTITGAAMGMGGIVGLMGVAMANQAVALGSAGLLASASTALAGLGTVAIGTAVLPVATVVVLGTAVAGAVTMGIGSLMRENTEKAAHFENAIKSGDKEIMVKLSGERLGISDWLKGAKNFLGKVMTGRVQDLQTGIQFQAIEQATISAGASVEGHDAVSAYELEDLFGNSVEESDKGKQWVVEKVGSSVWEKLGVAVTDEKIHECLSGTRADTLNSGKILDVNIKTGLVIQSLGRGHATVHRLKDFATIPEVGQNADISYKGGQMRVAQELSQSRGVSR
ncbi:MAG: hypothetical protein V4713_12290 [Pseudomonadota bacterium]